MLNSFFKNLWDHNKENRQKYILNFAKKHKKTIKTYLDLGCDNGGFTKKVAKEAKPKNTYGIEINEKRALEAEKEGIKVKRANLNGTFPFKDNTFDLITSDQVIEHLVDVDNFVSEIKRVLKPGGYAIIGTENLASFHNIFALVLGLQPFTGPNVSRRYSIGYHPIGPKNTEESFYKTDMLKMEDHKRVMTQKALVSLFKTYNFKIVDDPGFGYVPLPKRVGDFFAKIDKSHSQFIFVVVQKHKN